MTESYPDKVLKDLDGRNATNTPWQHNASNQKQLFKKRTYPAQMAEQDDDDYGYEDDANAIDEDGYEETWYEEDGDEVDDEDYDEDQVALVDDEGWCYVD